MNVLCEFPNNSTIYRPQYNRQNWYKPEYGLVAANTRGWSRHSAAGFYDGNMSVVRQRLRVTRPPLQDLSHTGVYIETMCSDYTTYRLEKMFGAYIELT